MFAKPDMTAEWRDVPWKISLSQLLVARPLMIMSELTAWPVLYLLEELFVSQQTVLCMQEIASMLFSERVFSMSWSTAQVSVLLQMSSTGT